MAQITPNSTSAVTASAESAPAALFLTTMRVRRPPPLGCELREDELRFAVFRSAVPRVDAPRPDVARFDALRFVGFWADALLGGVRFLEEAVFDPRLVG